MKLGKLERAKHSSWEVRLRARLNVITTVVDKCFQPLTLDSHDQKTPFHTGQKGNVLDDLWRY